MKVVAYEIVHETLKQLNSDQLIVLANIHHYGKSYYSGKILSDIAKAARMPTGKVRRILRTLLTVGFIVAKEKPATVRVQY